MAFEDTTAAAPPRLVVNETNVNNNFILLRVDVKVTLCDGAFPSDGRRCRDASRRVIGGSFGEAR